MGPRSISAGTHGRHSLPQRHRMSLLDLTHLCNVSFAGCTIPNFKSGTRPEQIFVLVPRLTTESGSFIMSAVSPNPALNADAHRRPFAHRRAPVSLVR